MADEQEQDGREQRNSPASLWAVSGPYMGLGLAWALSTWLFLMGGWWVDGKLGTSPVFLIVGAFVGAGAGFYSMYYHVVVEPALRTREKEEELP